MGRLTNVTRWFGILSAILDAYLAYKARKHNATDTVQPRID